MSCENDLKRTRPRVLVLTQDSGLRDIITHALDERSIGYQSSSSYNEVGIDFCLIIAGPDMDAGAIGTRLREIGGIPPCLLLLKNNVAESAPVRCCRCQTLLLPMDIFHLPSALDRLLVSD